MQIIDRNEEGANSIQVGGAHYQREIQPWDYIAANGLGYFEGCVIKYITRWRDKGGVQDLKKCVHYLEKLIEIEEKKNDKGQTGDAVRPG